MQLADSLTYLAEQLGYDDPRVQQVLAGKSPQDRATEIASRLSSCPGPEHLRARAYADVRPIDEHQPDFEG